MRAYITGIAGFAGSHLAEHLFDAGWEVAGLDQKGASPGNMAALAGRVSVSGCDIRREEEVARALSGPRPDVIFHLAAQPFVPSADKAPQPTLDANVKGTLNMLEACNACSPRPLFVLVSSAEVYGKVPPDGMPIGEDRTPSPSNMYALTKLCAEQIASYYHRVRSLPVVALRPFNHIGPRQSPDFVTSSFALQISEIEAGRKAPVLEVGNLEAARDFTDVRDMARAYRLAAERCEPGETYNICSGRYHTIGEMLETLLSLTTARIEVRQDPKRLRKSEVPLLYGDCSKFRRATGWQPEYDLRKTLEDILAYWRSRCCA